MIWRARGFLAAAIVVGLLAGAGACELFEPRTHVRNGELYQPGDSKYDQYFAQVHDLQAEAALVPDDVRAGRKPLIEALKLTMSSSVPVLVKETHDHVQAAASAYGGGASLDVRDGDVHFLTANSARGDGDAAKLAEAIEKTVRAELEREKKLGEVAPRAEQLRAAGKELEPHVREDFAKAGPQKISEVRQELTASLSVLDDVASSMNRQIHDSEDLVQKLQQACAVGAPPAAGSYPAQSSTSETADAGAEEDASAPSAPPATTSAPPPKPPPPKPPPPKPKPPVYVPPSRPAPPPPPPPAPTSTGEVFNP